LLALRGFRDVKGIQLLGTDVQLDALADQLPELDGRKRIKLCATPLKFLACLLPARLVSRVGRLNWVICFGVSATRSKKNPGQSSLSQSSLSLILIVFEIATPDGS